ncbi:hypothetical protein [Streptomyces sp. GESEQ-4]|uniref:hypothetical protein n=1 Tax=Streptomyces sp. GESEQ-4 TaxID=2812655 RepID=UPI001FF088BB|nr:hypothetical protein [Streptomyces sp. GESEQ-4]
MSSPIWSRILGPRADDLTFSFGPIKNLTCADIGVDVVDIDIDIDIDITVPFNCVVRVPQRDKVHAALTARGIGVGVHYPPNHLQPAFARWRRDLPVTEHCGGRVGSHLGAEFGIRLPGADLGRTTLLHLRPRSRQEPTRDDTFDHSRGYLEKGRPAGPLAPVRSSYGPPVTPALSVLSSSAQQRPCARRKPPQ